MNKTINNIIETMTILEKRLTYLEQNSTIIQEPKAQENPLENESSQEE